MCEVIRDFSLKKRYYRKDGSIIWVNLTVSPMWNIDEQPEHLILPQTRELNVDYLVAEVAQELIELLFQLH